MNVYTFLSQFLGRKGETCKEQTQKIRKTDKKLHFWCCETKKSRPQKTDFYRASFGADLCKEITQKIRKIKKHISEAVRGCTEAEKSRLPVRHIYIPKSNVSVQFGGQLYEMYTQKRRNPFKKLHFWGCRDSQISLLDRPRKLIFE